MRRTHAPQWFQRWTRRTGLDQMPGVRKLIIAVVGVTVLLIGIAMIVLPGPAVLVIPLGLAILASEFAWADRIIRRGTLFYRQVQRRRRGSRKTSQAGAGS